jgi:Fe-S cluster biogenesis protein NfuA
MIPLHPEPGPDPDTVLWVMPPGTLPHLGPACRVPSPLQELLVDGTVAHVVVGDGHLQVTLSAGHDWNRDGGRVRSALLAALERPEHWDVSAQPGEAGPAAGPQTAGVDAHLYDAARAALDGPVGELARSHGGAIELVSVEQGVVTVRMRGACHGCPAAALTLHARLERQLREVCPDLREVRSDDGAGSGRPRLAWLRPARP